MEDTKKNSVRIELLTDDRIVELTGDNVLDEHRDINLKIVDKIDPYEKGIYDPRIFGSMFSNSCNCGNIRTPGIRCPRCGSTLLRGDEAYKK